MSQTLQVSAVIAVYLLLNSSLNMLNKWALASFFPFPLLLTSVHMMFSFVVCAARTCPVLFLAYAVSRHGEEAGCCVRRAGTSRLDGYLTTPLSTTLGSGWICISRDLKTTAEMCRLMCICRWLSTFNSMRSRSLE